MQTPNFLESEIKRRKTFAIISHPDAGKTTLTEKLLLYGGAIHLAGAVRAKGQQKNTTSDWMEIEKQRGISVSSSVLQFEYAQCMINLLDTPGHKDFSEDTFRTLTAADSALMLIDAAKGVETQTRKLFEVCKRRGIPIFTMMNKLDRPSRDPLDLMDELEKVLGIPSTAVFWPIGLGDRFKGVYDRLKNELLLFQTEGQANVKGRLKPTALQNRHDPLVLETLKAVCHDDQEATELYDQFLLEMDLLEQAGNPFSLEKILKGELTPVFFGSAMNNFGVERFLEHFCQIGPSPSERKLINERGETKSQEAPIPFKTPTDPDFSGFIFKIQANMDPQHRDRVAFCRIISGRFERNMEVYHSRLKNSLKLAKPVQFFAQNRVTVEEAFAGDIIGLLDTSGELRIGDTLSEKKGIVFEKVPQFTPEHFADLTLKDPLKRKALKKGILQLSEEGVIQVYFDRFLEPILAAVGALQFEVLIHRLQTEYNVKAVLNPLGFVGARWIEGEVDLDFFSTRSDMKIVTDRDDKLVLLYQSAWALKWAQEQCKNAQLVSQF